MSDNAARVRLPLVDAARGVGLAMMALYHGAWDLSWFGFIDTDVGSDPAWKLFAWATAAVFLALVGAGLVLASHAGIERRRWFGRLARIVAAALLVSLATLWLFPDSWIFFGILHHIALASLLGLLFVRLPAGVTLALAGVALATPTIVALPAFDAPLLQWLGLGTVVPDSNDFVPLLPWFGAVLGGIAGGRLLLASPVALTFATRLPGGRVWRWLSVAGRHSLIVYLLHQPLLYGAVAGLAWLAPPAPAALTDEQLMERCVSGCVNVGGVVPACELRCQCAADTLQPLGLWAPAASGQLHPDDHGRVRELLLACPVF